MKIQFTDDFDWQPPERKGRVTIAYKKGMQLTVRRQCALDAFAAGLAVKFEKEN